jgi:hypothetical protein
MLRKFIDMGRMSAHLSITMGSRRRAHFFYGGHWIRGAESKLGDSKTLSFPVRPSGTWILARVEEKPENR